MCSQTDPSARVALAVAGIERFAQAHWTGVEVMM
jgi:hypothetical protein